MIRRLGSAFFISSGITAVAFQRRSLSTSGAAGGLLVGTIILGLGGWLWGALLGVFFVSSSLLSHFKENEKREAAEKFEKGHTRDFAQAMANGGLGALIALGNALLPSPAWYHLYTGVMATVTADTWATELGTLSKEPPRLITTGQVVEVGSSGGVSLLGTAVSFIGGLLIGLAGAVMQRDRNAWRLPLIGAISGSTLRPLASTARSAAWPAPSATVCSARPCSKSTTATAARRRRSVNCTAAVSKPARCAATPG